MLRHWLQLALTEGIGPVLTARIIEAAGSAEAACESDESLLQRVDGIGAGKSAPIVQALRRARDEVDAELARASKSGATIVCREDDAYPALLREIPDPPPVLYVRGSLEPRDLNALAIVGSRRCSFYGREQAERFAALLAGAAITVVSGGARGIDSAAHRGALSASHGRTVAVLGSGLDVPYPPENSGLFAQIAQRGAIVSEYPMGTPPMAENFPRRNRIVSGMSRGVLVVEADERSGALITARQACDDHGRPVFALPGRVDNKLSAGPHRLIRDGATLVTSLEEILEGLGPLPQSVCEDDVRTTPQTVAEPDPSISAEQQVILSTLDGEALDAETIVERSSLPAQVVFRELTFLTLKGMVRRVDAQHFARRGR
jgi:DNA processing protein